MKFDWLKTILGDSYTEDMDTKIAEEMPKHFVLKADFDAKNGALKPLQDEVATLKGQIGERDKQIEELGKLDAEKLNARILELETANAEEATKRQEAEAGYAADLKKRDFDTRLETAIAEAKSLDIKSVRAHLDGITPATRGALI